MTPKPMQEALEENPFAKLNDTVYQYLRERIITLEYEPGLRLVEAQLSEELGVSRSPVKAALKRLEQEDLVRQEPGKSPFVSPIRYEDCRMLLEARRGIEGCAARAAAEKITDGELEELRQALVQIKRSDQAGDPVQCAKNDTRFHLLVVEAARNKYLRDAYGLLQGNILRYLLYVLKQMRSDEGLREYEHHRPVYAALKSRSGVLAQEEMVRSIEHMYHAMRYL